MQVTISKESNSDTSSNQERRRACIPCTQSKRRCDKNRPSCQRCLDREVACRYSSRRPYARRSRPGKVWNAAVSEASPGTSTSALLDDDVSGGGHYYQEPDRHDSPSSDCLWFLRVEGWVIHHLELRPTPNIRFSVMKQYICCVRKWLKQWVDCNHSPMIHKALFANTGMPPCLQDAYATWALYEHKNAHNEDVVMRHVEDKANALLAEHCTEANILVDTFVPISPLSTLQHLARVLALFVYQYIRLFDGHVRQRAQAEKQISVLKSWTAQLWDSINIDVTVQNTFGGDYLTTQDKTQAVIKLWQSWILMENVRRVWMVASYTLGIYLVSRDGAADCQGTIDFTARQGLWDAASAPVWMRMLEKIDPLFIAPYEAPWLLETMTIEQIDAFALATMSLTLDSTMVDSWIAGSSDMHLEALMAK